jgi:Flp pilus assembly protein TadD
MGRLDEVIAACRHAIELKPDLPQPYFNLGLALAGKGRPREAVAAYRRVVELRPADAEAHCNLGVALEDLGRLDEAIAAYRQAVKLKPGLLTAQHNLARGLEKTGQFDAAIAAYRELLALKPDYAEAHYDLGNALRETGRLDKAVAAYRRAIELKPAYAEAHCNLGCVLRQQGEFVKAGATLTRGHELGSQRRDWPYPSAQWVEECRRLSKLADRLPAIVRGGAHPADAADQSACARYCHDLRRSVAAARLWASALAADPSLAEDLKTGYRTDAACASALAGCGQGADAGQLDEKERVRWRKQALDWLRADLTATGKLLENATPADCRLTSHRLRCWQGAPELASLRDAATVARLPAGEREEWKQLWAEVQALLNKAEVAQQADQRDRGIKSSR